MQYHYALAEGAEYRLLKWTEASGASQEFRSEMDMLRHAETGNWELVTVLVSGKTGGYRQWYFKKSDQIN